MDERKGHDHSAVGVALGFYYQSLFALLTLLEQSTDDAAVAVERLDDVELHVDGNTLLYQLKHSLVSSPPSITLRSKSLWRTVKVWVDILPAVTLSETTLHLVAVGAIPVDSPLVVLLTPRSERADLVAAMLAEASRVIDERAKAAGEGKSLPYADRVDGCAAFLNLGEIDRLNLLRRVQISHESPRVGEIEERVSEHLAIIPTHQRSAVARRLVEWWDRQVLYSLCDQRERSIARTELQQEISAIIADLERDKLVADFELANPPNDYQPDGMLARQIELVRGHSSDHSRAIREEWRAREQRSKWVNENPGMAVTIGEYDLLLTEYWSDRHVQMVESCENVGDSEMCNAGLQILRWTHETAPTLLRPIVQGWNCAYYVRGSYQVLAVNMNVGWHPQYAQLLGDDK